MNVAKWVSSVVRIPEECACRWTSYGDAAAGWWREFTNTACPLHGVLERDVSAERATDDGRPFGADIGLHRRLTTAAFTASDRPDLEEKG